MLSHLGARSCLNQHLETGRVVKMKHSVWKTPALAILAYKYGRTVAIILVPALCPCATLSVIVADGIEYCNRVCQPWRLQSTQQRWYSNTSGRSRGTLQRPRRIQQPTPTRMGFTRCMPPLQLQDGHTIAVRDRCSPDHFASRA